MSNFTSCQHNYKNISELWAVNLTLGSEQQGITNSDSLHQATQCALSSLLSCPGSGFLLYGLQLSQKMRHTAPGNKEEGLCVTIQVWNPSWMWASGTYKNPFPQPKGPKKSSVGRQTFLHTPLKLGQDHGKDAASFSTTGVPNQCTFTKLKTSSLEPNALWLTIEQQDNQERQRNQAIAGHSRHWLWC